MFERLTESFGSVYRKLSGKGSISESNVREAMEEVRAALIDADVNHHVVDRFMHDRDEGLSGPRMSPRASSPARR
jgi:signal recognition particle subunit SRP54